MGLFTVGIVWKRIYFESMRVSVVFLFVFLMLVSISEAQKGGAKAGMRRGGRNGGRGGSSRRGGSNHAAETGMDMGGGGSGRRACVGLCYLRKLQGKDPLPERKPRKPCIGLCHLKKLKELNARRG